MLQDCKKYDSIIQTNNEKSFIIYKVSENIDAFLILVYKLMENVLCKHLKSMEGC